MRRLLLIGGLFGLLICAIWLVAPATISRAQVIIDPPPTAWPPPWPEPQPQLIDQVKIQEQRVDVTIDAQLAQVALTQILRNDSARPIEGTYVFPLPENAAISDFQMTVDGQVIEGEILRKDEARRTYEEIVRQRRDPALLEYLGRDLFQVSVFPIPARESRTLTLAYTQVIEQREGLNQFRYPLLARQITQAPIESLVLNIEIRNQAGLRTIYSPNYTIDVERLSDQRARIGYEETNATPSGDFVLYYGSGEEAIGVNVLSYQPAGEDGYFLLMAAPSVDVNADDVVARDILMVIDVSGSMEGAKLEQAQAAAHYVVEQLNPADRFNLLSFSTGVRHWATTLQPATADQRTSAADWIADLDATGSTDINRALLEAIAQLDAEDPNRPAYLIFLTDGLPTQGERDVIRIMANVENNLPSAVAVRLFAFGVGYDVNTMLLDTLSSDLGGRSSYVRPDERIDEEVSHFYNGISTPVLSNVTLEFETAATATITNEDADTEANDGQDAQAAPFHVDELYPYPLPDLFAGEQLVVAGRYRTGDTADIILHGEVNGKPVTYQYPAQAFVTSGGEPHVARLWAARKIGALLQEIRRNGPDQELIDAIVDLSLQFGIVTPYTSAYVPEPVTGGTGGLVPAEAAESVADGAPGDDQALLLLPQATAQDNYEAAATAMRSTSGEQAVKLSDSINRLEADAVVAAERNVQYVSGKSFAAQVIRVAEGERAVTRWVDTQYQPAMELTTVAFGSDCYFALFNDPQLAEWLTVAPEMIVLFEEQALLITAEAVDVTPVCPVAVDS